MFHGLTMVKMSFLTTFHYVYAIIQLNHGETIIQLCMWIIMATSWYTVLPWLNCSHFSIYQNLILKQILFA